MRPVVSVLLLILVGVLTGCADEAPGNGGVVIRKSAGGSFDRFD